MKTGMTEKPNAFTWRVGRQWGVAYRLDDHSYSPQRGMTHPLGMLMHINMPALMTCSRKEAAV
jgi:hypothetical protein